MTGFAIQALSDLVNENKIDINQKIQQRSRENFFKGF